MGTEDTVFVTIISLFKSKEGFDRSENEVEVSVVEEEEEEEEEVEETVLVRKKNDNTKSLFIWGYI